MESIKKIIEKEEIKQKKNPGKLNRQKNQERNKARRGEPIPTNRIVESKKVKKRNRNSLKKDLEKTIKDM